MLDFLHRAVTVDSYTLVVVSILAGWGGVLAQSVLSRTVLALMFVPGFVLGALIVNYTFEIFGFQPTPDRETNIVIGCTLGMMLALLVLLLTMRAASYVSRLIVERYQFRQDMQKDATFKRELRRIVITDGPAAN